MKELVLLLSENDLQALGDVRCFPGLQAAAAGSDIWVRGIPVAGKTPAEIRRLPSRATFLLGDNDLLFPLGALTPVQKLEPLNWKPLTTFLPVTLPVSPLPGRTEEKHLLRLASSGRSEEGAALLTSFRVWEHFAGHAPAIRLEALQFAVSEEREALILGTPLPPLPGKTFWQRGNLLLPFGFDFDPPAGAQLVPGRDAGTFFLFSENGKPQRIPAAAFVPASRSAIRITAANIANG